MLIEENKAWRLFACYWLTRLNTQKTFSCSVVIMSVLPSIVFMASTTNAKEDTTSSYGKHLLTALTASQLPLLLMKKFYACTVDSHQNLVVSTKSRES